MNTLNDWTAFLLHPGTVLFTGSIGVMVGFFMVELLLTMVVGGGIGHAVDHAFAAHVPHVHVHVPNANTSTTAGGHSPDGGSGQASLLQWLQLGHVPFMVWVTVFLTAFGLIGLGGQSIAHEMLGHYLSPWIAAPVALLASLPIVRALSKKMARWVPQEESWAVNDEDFVGSEAVVMLGVATAEEPAQAKLQDVFGRDHYVMVVPSDPSANLTSGTRVRLMRRLNAARFAAEPLLGVLPEPLLDVNMGTLSPQISLKVPHQDRSTTG